MLRTLPSKNKLMKMNMSNFSGYDGTRECAVCGVLSDSSHLLAYCIFPAYSLYALNNLEVWKSKFPNLSLNQLHLEFQTSIHNIQDSSLIAQLDLLFIEIKTLGFNLCKDPTFHAMNARRLHIHLIRTVKNLLELIKGTKISRRYYWWIESILEDLIEEESILTEFYRIEFSHL